MQVWTTLYASIFVLWRGSQGKPIEARLANHHIKYLHGDRLVSNTKRKREEERRRVCRGRGKIYGGGWLHLVGVGEWVGVRIGLTCKG